MASRLGNLFRRRTAVETGRRNPAFVATIARSSQIYDRIPLGKFIDDDKKGQLARHLYLETNLVCNSLTPIATCREKLATTMMQFAAYQVLVIPPPPEEDPSGLRGQPGVTGGLKQHLVQVSKNNANLRSELYGVSDAPDFETVWAHVRREYWRYYWFLETFNAARIELGDSDSDPDWFLPFKHAASVNQEHIYRRELELPPAFDRSIATEAATAYSIFTDIVLSGAQNPAQEWREYHRFSNLPMPNFDR